MAGGRAGMDQKGPSRGEGGDTRGASGGSAGRAQMQAPAAAPGLLRQLLALPWALLALLRPPRLCLKDKVVVITGASSGIGEAMAHKFYIQGCRVVLASRRVDELNRVKNELLRTHSTVPTHVPVVMPLDLSDIPSIPGVVKKILDIYGHIDILVNNGGISFRGKVIDTEVDVDIKIMTVNYFAQIAITKAVLPHMIKRRSGNIVFMSSIQGRVVMPCRSAYSSTKHALQAFGDCLRSEVSQYNIVVSMICPSYVRTSLSLNALTSKGIVYGKTDKLTTKGDSAELIADKVVDVVETGKKELLIGPLLHRSFVYIRVLLTTLYFKLLILFEKEMSKEI